MVTVYVRRRFGDILLGTRSSARECPVVSGPRDARGSARPATGGNASINTGICVPDASITPRSRPISFGRTREVTPPASGVYLWCALPFERRPVRWVTRQNALAKGSNIMVFFFPQHRHVRPIWITIDSVRKTVDSRNRTSDALKQSSFLNSTKYYE